MSDIPVPYVPQYSFYDFSSLNPNIPAPGQKWDIEYQNIRTALDTTQSRLAEIQRADGRLKNGIVDRYALSSSFASGVNPPAPWEPFTAYSEDDSVMKDGSWYWNLAAHTSGATFNPSLWQFIGTFFSEDPLDLALTKDSLVDGILSADADGRAKMEDGYVTIEKLDVGAAKSFAKAWATFCPQELGQTFNFSFDTNHITAVAAGSLATFAGQLQNGSIRFTGLTGNNAALNGVWKILTFDDVNTITFDIGSTPAGALSSATGWMVRIYDSFNIKTISKISDGLYFITFDTPTTDPDYSIGGSVSTYYPNSLPLSILGIQYDQLPTTSGFRLACSSYISAGVGFSFNNPDRIMFQVFGH
jgi:hypothetical protein